MRRRPMRFQRQGGTRAPLGRRAALTLLAILTALVTASTAGAAGPEITFTLTGSQGDNGWYRSNVGIAWVVKNGTAVSGCQSTTLLSETAGIALGCTATDGTVTNSSSVAIKIDKTAPVVNAVVPQRPPDANGWYNHPVSFSFSGADALSGLVDCSQATYSGPDNGAAVVGGTCRDRAGNTGSNGFGLSYDATPPVLKKVSVTSSPDADSVRWISSSPSDRVVVQRAVRGDKKARTVFRGTGTHFADRKIQDGLEYTYTVQTTDQAGNASRRISAAGLPKVLTLRKTPYVPRAAGRPILRWAPARGATYYNVQLFRGSKRVFAAWPTRARLGLPATWKWAGHRYRLRAGHYRWYVWAGLGRRSFARYKTLGSAQFIVPRG
jgi:hypothetical protein